MNYTAFYSSPLLPAGLFFGAILLLMIVPVFAMAALALVVLVELVLVIALAGAVVSAPFLIAHAARRFAPLLCAGVRRAVGWRPASLQESRTLGGAPRSEGSGRVLSKQG